MVVVTSNARRKRIADVFIAWQVYKMTFDTCRLTTRTMTNSASLSRRARKPKRRFSSASIGPWKNAFAPLGTNRPSTVSSPGMPAGSLPYTFLSPSATDPSEHDEVEHVEHFSHSDDENTLFIPRSGQRPMTYASLPPTPIFPSSPSPPLTPVSPVSPTSAQFEESSFAPPPFSLWDYLREELLATDFDSHQELKWERVSNFLQIPWAMEKVRVFI